MQRFKTIIFNTVAMVAAWLSTTYDIDLPEDQQVAITTTIIALGNIGLSICTKNPIFEKKSKQSQKSKEDNKSLKQQKILESDS